MQLHDLRVMLCVLFFVVVGQTVAQAANGNVTRAEQTTSVGSTPTLTTSTPSATTKSNPGTTVTSIKPTSSTPTVDELCSQHSKSCDDCLGVEGAKCLWCYSNNTCQAYPLSKGLPPKDMCPLEKARWGVCWLNFEALIIGVSTVGGILLLTITCCCVYCCCCRKRGRKYEKEDARFNAEKMERKAKSDDRRTERKERLDEIRRKYGLVKDEPYQRFES